MSTSRGIDAMIKTLGRFSAQLALAIVQGLVVGAMLALPLAASQNNLFNPTVGTLSGLTQVQTDNNAMDSLNTCNSGSSAPANQLSGVPSAGNCWLDTSVANWLSRKIYDGTNWIRVFWLDQTNHLYTGIIGGGTIPSIASATTTDLCSVNPATVKVTGTTTITGFGSTCVQGQIKKIIFTGALTLTYNATSLIVPGAANITTANGDTAEAVYLGSSNWQVLNYLPATTLPAGPIASHTVVANTTGGSAAPAADTLTSIIDAAIGSTQGQILYRGASAWSVLSPGTANQLLQTGGAGANPSWATVAAPVLLNTVTGSGVASLADTSSITATYPSYLVIMQSLVCASASQPIYIQQHLSGGSFQSSGYVSAVAGSVTASGTFGVIMTSSETMTAAGFSGEFKITNPTQTSTPKLLWGLGYYENSGLSARAVNFGGGYTGANTAVDGVQAICGSGNITGTLRVYGLP